LVKTITIPKNLPLEEKLKLMIDFYQEDIDSGWWYDVTGPGLGEGILSSLREIMEGKKDIVL
jgi:hypothetical protein